MLATVFQNTRRKKNVYLFPPLLSTVYPLAGFTRPVQTHILATKHTMCADTWTILTLQRVFDQYPSPLPRDILRYLFHVHEIIHMVSLG